VVECRAPAASVEQVANLGSARSPAALEIPTAIQVIPAAAVSAEVAFSSTMATRVLMGKMVASANRAAVVTAAQQVAPVPT
jgi:hypothetical protein